MLKSLTTPMATNVHSLLTHALSEIAWRAPDYLARFPLLFAAPDRYYAAHRARYPHSEESAASFAAKFEQGLEYLRRQGARIETSCGFGDPVAAMLSETIADALATDHFDIPESPDRADFSTQFQRAYREGSSREGRRYFVRRRGSVPLLLIPALGVPLHVWSKLLLDPSHDFRIVVAETRSCSLFRGGMAEAGSIEDDGSDLADVIAAERLTGIDVVAWCNGAKVALELLAAGAAVRSLALVSPSLSGPRSAPSDESKYESGLRQIITAIGRNPAMAPFIARGFEQLTQPVDWDSLSGRAEDRARTLFALPARSYAPTLTCPFSDIESLRKYAQRGCRDYAYPTAQRLGDVRVPCLLITGDSDHVINNAFVARAMSACGAPVVNATIRGAGHYTFDLQYPYFRNVLAEFIAQRAPKPRVRVDTQTLSSAQSLEQETCRLRHLI